MSRKPRDHEWKTDLMALSWFLGFLLLALPLLVARAIGARGFGHEFPEFLREMALVGEAEFGRDLGEGFARERHRICRKRFRVLFSLTVAGNIQVEPSRSTAGSESKGANMLSHSLSPMAQTAVAVACVAAGNLRATRREACARCAGLHPCETGALGNG